MKTDIAYIVSHGFAARMVIQTDLLGKLVDQGQKVALIAPDREDENLKKYCAERGVDLYEFNPASTFWDTEYMKSRKYFLEDIKANSALWEKHVYDTRFNRSRHPWKQLRPRLLLLAHTAKNWLPGIKDWYRKRENRHLESAEAQALIQSIDPRILIATYPVNFSEAMLLKAGNEASKVKTMLHLLSWDNISSKGHFPQLADEYIVWGEVMKKELKEYYDIPDENIFVGGVPHLDLHVRSRENNQSGSYLEALGLRADEPYLFFGMSATRFAPHEIDIVEWLAEAIRKDEFGSDVQLIVRPHPHTMQGSFSAGNLLVRLKKLTGDRVAVDFPNMTASKMPWSMQSRDMERLSQLLAGCSICLNSGSTLSIDAMMGGRPALLTAFDAEYQLDYWASAVRLVDYRHQAGIVEKGGIEVARSFTDLRVLIEAYLADPERRRKKRSDTIQAYCANYVAGRGTELICDFLAAQKTILTSPASEKHQAKTYKA